MVDDGTTGEGAPERSASARPDDPGAILRRLVETAIDADLETLTGSAEVVERGGEPDPAARVLDCVAGDDSVVGVVPRIEPSLARGLAGRVDGEVRLVLTGSAGDRLTGASGAPLRLALANHGVTVSVHDGDSPVGVLLVGDRALVGVFDDDGLAAVLSSDAPPVREWVTATYRRYAAAAESV